MAVINRTHLEVRIHTLNLFLQVCLVPLWGPYCRDQQGETPPPQTSAARKAPLRQLAGAYP